jgi:tetraacyldisaccharide 4'-kinase
VVYLCSNTRRDDGGDGSRYPPDLVPLAPERLTDRKVFAFSGIAQNEDFLRSLTGVCRSVRGFRGFPDHHPYSKTDLASIAADASASGAETIVTTEKDHARIGRRINWPGEIVVFGVQVDFGTQADAFEQFIKDRFQDFRCINLD